MPETKLKPCPFCGGEVDRITGFGNFKHFRCQNKGCGAIVSFDNRLCNTNSKKASEYFNRRAENGKMEGLL